MKTDTMVRDEGVRLMGSGSSGLRELAQTYPGIYRWLQGRETAGSHYFLERSKSGLATCYYSKNGNKKYVYSTYDPRKMNVSVQEQVILLIGLGLGYELAKIYDESRSIYVYEPDPEVWQTFLRVENNIKYLYCSNIYMFTDLDCELSHVKSSCFQVIESANARINKDAYVHIYPKIISKQKDTVLIYEYHVFAYNLYEAFTQLGYECHLRPWIGEGFTREDIKQLKPDVIITININQYVRNITNGMGIFYVSWTIDSPSFTLYDNKNVNSLSLHFCYDQALVEHLRRKGFSNIDYLPPATKIQSDSDVANKHIDISFAGNVQYDTNLWSIYNKYLSESLSKFMWEVIEVLSGRPSGACLDAAFSGIEFNGMPMWQAIWEQVGAGFAELPFIEPEARVYSHLSKEISRRFRIRLIKEIINQFPSTSIHVYGNPVWGEEIGDYYKGSLNEIGMFNMFQEVKINLNFIQPQAGEHALPMRVYDILGSRGFMLSNYRKSLDMEFKANEHLATYHDDIFSRIDHFLTNQSEMDYVRNNGFRKVSQNDTFLHRARAIAGRLTVLGILKPAAPQAAPGVTGSFDQG